MPGKFLVCSQHIDIASRRHTIELIHTGLEDRTLLEQLGGYPEYARQVRFRLVPGVW